VGLRERIEGSWCGWTGLIDTGKVGEIGLKCTYIWEIYIESGYALWRFEWKRPVIVLVEEDCRAVFR